MSLHASERLGEETRAVLVVHSKEIGSVHGHRSAPSANGDEPLCGMGRPPAHRGDVHTQHSLSSQSASHGVSLLTTVLWRVQISLLPPFGR